jgi:myo-inositol-1(or 4)-monophosphatase
MALKNRESPDMDRLVSDCRALAAEIRKAVLPHIGTHGARATVGTAVGGDATMAIDAVAEGVVRRFFEESGRYSIYTEDAGLVKATSAQAVLLIDPIDGTRPAAAGFESACVSVAATRQTESPTMADLDVGVVVEIKSGTTFVATAAGDISISKADGTIVQPSPSTETDLERIFWAGGFRGRPYLPVAAAVAALADRCSLGGSTFDLGSASYIMTRLITGQLDAYVDPGLRLVEEYPELEADFLRVGRGSIVCNAPYDIAAAYLCCLNAGVITTDAWGRSLAERHLLGSGREHQLSVVAAGNAELHAALIEVLGRSIRGMETVINALVAFGKEVVGPLTRTGGGTEGTGQDIGPQPS